MHIIVARPYSHAYKIGSGYEVEFNMVNSAFITVTFYTLHNYYVLPHVNIIT